MFKIHNIKFKIIIIIEAMSLPGRSRTSKSDRSWLLLCDYEHMILTVSSSLKWGS